MKRFSILLTLVIICGTLALLVQRRRVIESRRAAKLEPEESKEALVVQPPKPTNSSPSSELLRLRSEVTLLRKALDSPIAKIRSLDTNLLADEWEFVNGGGPRLSEQSDFHSFNDLSDPGGATPEAAFERMLFAFVRQGHERITETKMKEIFDLPDDFDDPAAKYSIDLGEGIGKERGYRIAKQERTAENEVKLTIDFEAEDGTRYRRDKSVVFHEGRWRVKLNGVRRVP